MKRLTLVAVMAVLAVPSAAHASFPGQNGRIAFAEDHALYTMNPDGTGVQTLATPPPRRNAPAWSPDGTKIAYTRGVPGSQPNLAVANADGTGETVIYTGAASSPAWSPDGTKIAFVATDSSDLATYLQIFVVNVTGGAPVQLTFDLINRDPSWSPDGSRITFTRPNRPAEFMGDFPADDIWVIDADGGNLVNLTDTDDVIDQEPDWSPDGSRIVFTRRFPDELVIVDPSTEVESQLLSGYAVHADWSPDATRILFLDINGNLKTVNADGTNPTLVRAPDSTFTTYPGADWQPIPYLGYVRPKGATPTRVPLVPAYAQCTSPNREHGPPLAFASCSPPTQQSQELTVGNGMTGFVRYGVIAGDPSTAADEADVSLRAEVTDVRVQGTLDDYAGEIQARATARLTDRNGDGSDPATVTNVLFPLAMPCTPTAASGTGSTCSVSTTLDALIPDAVTEKQRTILELGQVQVIDGGPDADPATEPNAVFLRQGLFVP